MTETGRIIRSQSGFFWVQTEADVLMCQLRGRLKRGPRHGDMAAVGDWVEVMRLPDGTGMVEAILPRTRFFARSSPDPKMPYQQILLANPDQVCLVFAAANPEPHLGMVDRFLVIAERQNIPARLIVNKLDLVGGEAAQAMFGHYPALGYPVIYASAKTGEGVAELRQALQGKVNLFTGPSGVGKSSLLNAMQPGLGLHVREVSETTSKGRHTTVVRELFPLDGGGFVADTPGIKALALWDISPEELDGYFPEMAGRVQQCAFSDCTHVHEPGCAVQAAVEAGQIHPSRYRSYLRMRFGEEEQP